MGGQFVTEIFERNFYKYFGYVCFYLTYYDCAYGMNVCNDIVHFSGS